MTLSLSLIVLRSMKPVRIQCQDSWSPVCASDCVTYKNECEMIVAMCEKKSNLHVIHRGTCGKSTPFIVCHLITLYGRVVRASAPPGTSDSKLIPSQVRPVTLKLVFTASLLDAQL